MNTRSKFQLESYGASLAVSILLNLFLLVVTSLILTFDRNISVPEDDRQVINIKSFRTVGKENGNKETFSVPQKSTKASQASSSKQKSKALNMSQLGSITTEESNKESIEMTSLRPKQDLQPQKSNYSFSSKPPLKQRLRKQQQQLQGDVLQNLAANPSFASALSDKGFNVQFDPPEGIKEDELNSIEKIFYSFQKRTYETYLNSFLKNYYSTLTSNPNLKKDLRSQRHRLNARVQFDRQGHILSVKILKSSESDSVHDLFETTLDDMRSIPNPPKDLLGKDGNFTIYYSLYIN